MIEVKNLKQIYRTPIKTNNLIADIFNRKFKESEALTGISFTIEPGSLIGFIGPNGAGKTTTMKILSGILFPTSGKVEVLGFNPFDKNPEFLKQIAFVMGQKNQLIWELPPPDSFRVTKAVYEIDDAAFTQNVAELTELLDIQDIMDQPVKTLSLGQRMKVELMNALLHKPKILFLDEPTIGLDIFAQTAIISFIKKYQKLSNATIMLTSHYMQDVQRLAERVILIDHGKIVADEPLKQLLHSYSSHKLVIFTLSKPLKVPPKILETLTHTYEYPQLLVHVAKDKLAQVLPKLMESLEYHDVTVESEKMEDIIAKVFGPNRKHT